MTLSHYPAKLQYLQDELFGEKQVQVGMLRLDQLHPVVSGNKIFKLHCFLQRAITEGNAGVITFGGAYSNHLVATAYACQQLGLESIGVVRGEQARSLSPTLAACLSYGMKLHFISRSQYGTLSESHMPDDIYSPDYLRVPEGGYHPDGAAGAALIMENIPAAATHICCPVGTATTVAGLISAAAPHQEIVAFPVLKGLADVEKRVHFLVGDVPGSYSLRLVESYHFGGYAKKNAELIAFMNQFFQKHGIPTDFVYTGKMMFGVIDCIRRDLFPQGSHIICVHTGGLQGNLSLPPGTLVF